MADMLIRLYDLPDHSSLVPALAGDGITLRRAIPPEKSLVVAWVGGTFGPGWADECETAFTRQPVSCHIAVRDGECVGFCCHEATCRDFLGPLGVAEGLRGKGVGTALVWLGLESMRQMGYAYAIVGGAGPRDFYSKCTGAVIIDNSSPGIYAGMLRHPRASS